MTCNLFCVYHDNTKLEEIKQYEHLIPYNINECNNGNMNRFICEYICQQNNINTNSDYIGFCNVGRYIKKEAINDFCNDNVNFYIQEVLEYSPKGYLGNVLCLDYLPELLDKIYEYLLTYGINPSENYKWARFELYITKTESYKNLIKFVDGLLNTIFDFYNTQYNLEGCYHIVEDNYMKIICDNAHNNLMDNRINQKEGIWYLNKYSKFYNSVDEEIEYVKYVSFKYSNPDMKYGNQLHRIIAYIIEYFIGIYICSIDKSYKVQPICFS